MESLLNDPKREGAVELAPQDVEKVLALIAVVKDHDWHALLPILHACLQKIMELEQKIERIEMLRTEIGSNTNPPQLLNSKQACELFGMCADTLNNYRKKGKLPAMRMGKGYLYEMADLVKVAGGRKI